MPVTFRHRGLNWLAFGIGVAAGALLIMRGMRNGARLTISRHLAFIPSLPSSFEGFRLLHISDLHLRRNNPMAGRVLSAVHELQPDLVCLTGDYALTALSLDDVRDFFAGLQPIAAVGVLGNSDYRPGMTQEVHAAWGEQVTMPRNGALPITRGEDALWIAGVDDPHGDLDDLPRAMESVPAGAPVILLAHSPEITLRRMDPRVRLVLCGHTHGGQICLPGGVALYRNSSVPAHLSSGMHPMPGYTIFVSRGVGVTRIPVRYACPPEIALITLTGRE